MLGLDYSSDDGGSESDEAESYRAMEDDYQGSSLGYTYVTNYMISAPQTAAVEEPPRKRRKLNESPPAPPEIEIEKNSSPKELEFFKQWWFLDEDRERRQKSFDLQKEKLPPEKKNSKGHMSGEKLFSELLSLEKQCGRSITEDSYQCDGMWDLEGLKSDLQITKDEIMKSKQPEKSIPKAPSKTLPKTVKASQPMVENLFPDMSNLQDSQPVADKSPMPTNLFPDDMPEVQDLKLAADKSPIPQNLFPNTPPKAQHSQPTTDKPLIPVLLTYGELRKRVKFPRSFSDGELSEQIEALFKDLQSTTYDLEYGDGVKYVIKDKDDWESAVKYFNSEKPRRLELNIVSKETEQLWPPGMLV